MDLNQIKAGLNAARGPATVQNTNSLINAIFARGINGPPALPAQQAASAPRGGSSYSSGYTAPAYNPQLEQGISNTQSAINRLGSQLNSGYSAIDASYQNALNQLLLGKNQAESSYKDNKKTSAQGYVSGKNTIGANAGNTLSSLMRLLGQRGSGSSSAATVSAPQAVARDATIRRSDLSNTFGANERALDTNWGNYMIGYDNEVAQAGSQREQKRQELSTNIENNRASLLQSLAQLVAQRSGAGAAQPYLDQANAILDRTANVTTAPINFKTQAYTAPTLDKYIVNPNATPTAQGQAQGNDYFSPYLGALLNRKQSNTVA